MLLRSHWVFGEPPVWPKASTSTRRHQRSAFPRSRPASAEPWEQLARALSRAAPAAPSRLSRVSSVPRPIPAPPAGLGASWRPRREIFQPRTVPAVYAVRAPLRRGAAEPCGGGARKARFLARPAPSAGRLSRFRSRARWPGLGASREAMQEIPVQRDDLDGESVDQDEVCDRA